MRAKVKVPTAAEDAEINRGIALDPDNPEWTEADFRAAQPAREELPPDTYRELVRRRGPGKTPAKVVVSLRLPPDLVAGLRAMGPRWQTQAGEALAALVAAHDKNDRPATDEAVDQAAPRKVKVQ